MRLPEALVGQTPRPEFSSLAARDLYRGQSVALPSGEGVARALGLTRVSITEFKPKEAPWSETRSGFTCWAEIQQSGERLGEVGARIVAEVIFELLRLDRLSIPHDQAVKTR